MLGRGVTIIGNPADRRVIGFRQAASTAAITARVLPWRNVATGSWTVPAEGLVRLDSVGDDREVDRLLRGDAVTAEPGEIRLSRDWYRGFSAVLACLEATVASERFLSSPTEVAVQFDKRLCAERLRSAGIRVPRSSNIDPHDLGGVVEACREIGSRRVFLKPRYGSSGAGVVALALDDARLEAVSNVEIDPRGRLFYSTRSRRASGLPAVERLVGALCADSVVVEQWYPKAGFDDHIFDLRVLVIGGEPRHVVVRSAKHPITNLNLGNRRGDVDAIRDRMGPHWLDALDTCAAVGAAFPGCLHVGVDLLVAPGFRHHAVAEVNAFGDLLPGVVSRGETTFSAEVAALDRFVEREAA